MGSIADKRDPYREKLKSIRSLIFSTSAMMPIDTVRAVKKKSLPRKI